MDWSRGYKAIYYAMTVNPNTWADVSRFEIDSGNVSRVDTGLRGSADFVSNADGFNERLIRIYVDAVQNDDISHNAIFTGYAVSPTIDGIGDITTQKYSCYSVLKPADDILLDRGWYAPINANTGSLIRNLLSVTGAPFTIDGETLPLENYIVADDGETHLSMVDKILRATNCELVINGMGELTLRKIKYEPIATFEPTTNDIIEPTYSITNDWFDVPNVLRVVMDDVSATVRDDSENSIYSTINRGREIWREENGVNLVAGDTLAEYAKRRLKELQMVGTEASYTRRFVPDISVCDIVRLRHNILKGLYRIKEQKISLSHNITTSETVDRIDTDIEVQNE